MKKEVSCRVFIALFEIARRKNIALENVCAGVRYPLSYLQDKNERVEWDVFRTITSNLRKYIPEDEFERLGFETSRRGALYTKAISLIAKLLFNCRDLYFWTNSRNGPAPQLFSCFSPTTRQLGKNSLEFTLLLNPEHEDCPEMYLLTKGGLEAIPTLIGLEPAKVEMRRVERGAVYVVVYPDGGGILSRVRNVLTWPWTARSVARELKDANEVLHERYTQLEEAKSRIEHQALQLQTAFSISEVIRKNLDLDATLAAVAQSLIDVGHFAAAEVTVAAASDGDNLNRSIARGTVPSDARLLSQPLEARNRSVGKISVWLLPETDTRDAEDLLNQIAPTIAMEISDALSFALLTEYKERDMLIQREFSRQQIESQERERKRLAGELHDGLGQDLLVASNQLKQCMEELREPHEELRQVATILQGTIDAAREMSANLHPHHLDRLGFCASIEAMAEKLRKSSGLAVTVACADIDGLLLNETELQLYRILQEALTNVVRHASARNVMIELKKEFGAITATVSDDGKGFSLSELTSSRSLPGAGDHLRGFGLSSMAERARIIGGIVKVESSPGSGTTVRVMLPISL